MKTKLILFGIVLTLILVSGCGQETTVEIDPEVIEELENKEEVMVIVDLIDVGGVDNMIYNKKTIRGEEYEIFKEKMKINLKIQSEVLSTLSEGEFKVRRVSQIGISFSGNITKEGLNRLKQNPSVTKIYLDKLTPGTEGIVASEEVLYCYNSGGLWLGFSSPCSTDECDLLSRKAIYPGGGCGAVITESCDCGSNKCWNKTNCIPICEYNIEYQSIEDCECDGNRISYGNLSRFVCWDGIGELATY